MGSGFEALGLSHFFFLQHQLDWNLQQLQHIRVSVSIYTLAAVTACKAVGETLRPLICNLSTLFKTFWLFCASSLQDLKR